MMPLHFLSVEHVKFREKFGKKKGDKFTHLLGMISGCGFFIWLFGLWISPQPRFRIPILEDCVIIMPGLNIMIYIVHLIISLPIILCSAWLGIVGVRGTGLEVSETHHTKKIITKGIYAKVRHPQYLGAILSHIGFIIMLSAFYALLSTPLIIFYNYLVAWKEEKELIKEFGEEYVEYRNQVPMFFPSF